MNYGTNNGCMDVVQNLWDIDIYINTGFIHQLTIDNGIMVYGILGY